MKNTVFSTTIGTICCRKGKYEDIITAEDHVEFINLGGHLIPVIADIRKN